MPITLPIERSEVDKRWTSQKSAIVGPAGIGKSELLSHAENGFYIQTEAGLNGLAVKKLPCTSFPVLKEILTALIQADQAKKFPFDLVIVDTVDELIDLINEEVIARGRVKFADAIKKGLMINTIGDIPNGAGWQWSTELIKMTFDKLENLPAHIAYIGHVDNKEIKSPTEKYHRNTLSIGGKTGNWLVAWADHFLNIEASMRGSKLVRSVRTRPTQHIEAKSRGNMVPDGWQWGPDMAENFKQFRGFFT